MQHDADPSPPPECAAAEERAGDHAKALTKILANMGYSFALVSLRRTVRGEGDIVFAPGGSAYLYQTSVAPVLRREAVDLRRLADRLDKAAEGSPDVLGGYTEQVGIDEPFEVADTLTPEDPA